ncbi:MAG: ribosome-associated translation inhibitor RaiA [Acholeplasmatales bacterium]|jgi:ribosomal subunit interface protein|nr:ribosome-associated translation inhibitor RaiA [Acholeplasmatales bacterium]
MKLEVIGKEKYEVSESEKAFAEKAFAKVLRIFHKDINTDVKVIIKKVFKEYKVEASVTALGEIIRSEVIAKDLFKALTETSDKIVSQIKKVKGKVKNKFNRVGIKEVYTEEFERESQVSSPEVDIIDGIKVRTKVRDLRPISLEDAIYQMELTGHPFYLYYDKEIERVAVVYKRLDGAYATLEANVIKD